MPLNGSIQGSNIMKKAQSGFTMIELIVVIVILGILAATALPKFIDMRSDAQASALAGVIGAAATAHNLNYAGCAVMNNVVTLNKCVKINNCSQTATIMQGGALPTGYTIAAAALGTGATGSNGIQATCTVSVAGYTIPAGAVKTFSGISAGN
jgi:MSHA pilin protein MshA